MTHITVITIFIVAKAFTFHRLRCRLFSREVNIKLRVHIVLEPVFHRDLLLSHVGDRLGTLGTQYRRRNESSILGKVGASVEYLENILRLVDGIVEVSLRGVAILANSSLSHSKIPLGPSYV